MPQVPDPHSSSPPPWDRLIEAVEPASLLVVIEQRMSPALRASTSAEDILQDALLHAWRDRARCEWRGLKSFRAWLLTVIDHRIHDAADREAAGKRNNGRPVAQLGASGASDATTSSGALDFPAASTTPSRLAMHREQAEVMKRALEGLPDDQRDVVRLRVFEQLPLEEIARRLDLGVEAVRHRFRKGSEAYARRVRSALATRSRPLPRESATGAPSDSSP